MLILDEPTAGLDPSGRDEILFKIRDMHKRMNLTVVLVSHSMEDVAKLADRILVMNGGKIEMFDCPEKVFAQSGRLTEIRAERASDYKGYRQTAQGRGACARGDLYHGRRL